MSMALKLECTRIAENKYQVLIDHRFGFVVDFNGVQFFRSHDGCIVSKDAFIFVNDDDVSCLIDALRIAPDGERLMASDVTDNSGEGNYSAEAVFLEELRRMQ
jgi:hypothetical protein